MSFSKLVTALKAATADSKYDDEEENKKKSKRKKRAIPKSDNC